MYENGPLLPMPIHRTYTKTGAFLVFICLVYLPIHILEIYGPFNLS